METYKSYRKESRLFKITTAEMMEDVKGRVEELYVWMKENIDIEQTGRNLDVKLVRGGRNDVDVQLIRDDGHKRSLRSFLPQEYKFQSGLHYQHNRDSSTVFFPEDEVNNKCFLLSLSHEIGHARNSINPFISFIETGGLMLGAVKYNRAKKAGLDESQKDYILKLMPEVIFPDWLLKIRRNVSVKDERSAHAKGIRIMRQLNTEGYKVFAGFKKNEVLSFTNAALTSYNIGDYAITGEESHHFTKKAYK